MTTTLCITGMHRSGTSLTTAWLEKCRLPIHDGNLDGANIGNTKGQFEDKDFVNLHINALRLDNDRSKGWKRFTSKPLNFTDTQISQAQKIVDKRNEKYSIWGWKDPRTTIFLEEWKKIIPHMKALLIWRSYSEVVQSLIKRSEQAREITKKSKRQFTVEVTPYEALKLWFFYNEKVCDYKQKYSLDTVLLPLEYVIREDRETLVLLRKKLNVELEYCPILNQYESRLLSRENFQNCSLTFSLWQQWSGWKNKSQQLEEKLLNMSDAQVC